ncbi:hypothetical protein ABBQ32_012416 [Trebouxia sp. C0010 RCD-2024]
MAGADAAAFEETVRRTRRLQQSHRTASQFDTAGACRIDLHCKELQYQETTRSYLLLSMTILRHLKPCTRTGQTSTVWVLLTKSAERNTGRLNRTATAALPKSWHLSAPSSLAREAL